MSHARAFDRLEKEFFNGWVKQDPLRAVEFGFYDGNDGRLPDGSVEKVQGDVAFLQRMKAALGKIDASALPPHRRIDHELAEHLCRQWIFELDTLKLWERAPEGPRIVCESLYQILGRNYAPLKVRLKTVMDRLAVLPRYLEQSRSRLRNPCRLLIEHELETITRIPAFFHTVREIGRLNMTITAHNVLCRALENVQNAMESYCNWLIIDVLSDCPNNPTIDPSLYSEYLRVRGIREGLDTLVKWGGHELDNLKARLREQGRKIRRKVPVEDVRARIKNQHPPEFDGVLKFIRDEVARSRDFVEKSGFATLPGHEQLFIVETPTYLRHFSPLSGYWPPARFAEKCEGFFFLTPGDCDSHSKQNEYSYPELSNMTIHEAFPGHHLADVWASRHPSLIRSLSRAPETREGWAHYCDERVRDMAVDVTPPIRFMQTVDLLWGALRMQMDVRLSTGKQTPADAANQLIDDVGMDRIGAEAEIRRYLATPTYQLSYLLGKEAIKELKRDIRAKMKGRFTEKFFHDAVLQSGALPMGLLKREVELRTAEELRKPPAPPPAPVEVKTEKKKEPAKREAPKKPAVTPKPAATPKLKPKPKPTRKSKVKKRPVKRKRPVPKRTPARKKKIARRPRRKSKPRRR